MRARMQSLGRRWLFVALSALIALPCCIAEGMDSALAARQREPAGLYSGRDQGGRNGVQTAVRSSSKTHRYKQTSIDLEGGYAASAESRSEDSMMQRSLALPYQIVRGASMLPADLWNAAFPSGVDESDQVRSSSSSSSSVRTKKTIRRRRRLRNGEEVIEEEEVVVEERQERREGLHRAVGKRLMQIPRMASVLVTNGGMMVAHSGNEGLQRVRRHFHREEEDVTREWESPGMNKKEVQRRSVVETSRIAADQDECAVSSSSWRSSSSSKVSNQVGAPPERKAAEDRDVLPIAGREKQAVTEQGKTRSSKSGRRRESTAGGGGAAVAAAGQWSGGRALSAVLDLGWLRLELEEGVWERTVERVRAFGARVSEQAKRALAALGVLGAKLWESLKVLGASMGGKGARAVERIKGLGARMGEEGRKVAGSTARGARECGASIAKGVQELRVRIGAGAHELCQGLTVVLGEGRGVAAVCAAGIALFYSPLLFLPADP